MARFLSAGFECWNCTNLAPETTDVGFTFVAWEPNGDWHPVCADCACRPMEVAAGVVVVRKQVAKNVFEDVASV